jgi:hypothetical protein
MLNIALFQGITFGLIGIAESLPTAHRRVSGILRVLAIVTIVLYLAMLLLARSYSI